MRIGTEHEAEELEDLECCLCRRATGRVVADHLPEERILIRTGGILVSGARGALVEGWTLVFPAKHYERICDLPRADQADLAKVRHSLRCFFRSVYNKPLLSFEHGLSSRTAQSHGCVSHAHVHCLPFDLPIRKTLRRYFSEVKLSSRQAEFKECGIVEGVSYLFYESDVEGDYLYISNHVPSQFMRQIIADEIGLVEEWDWRSFPRPEMVAQGNRKVLDWLQEQRIQSDVL